MQRKENTVATFIDLQNFSTEGKNNDLMVQVPNTRCLVTKIKHT